MMRNVGLLDRAVRVIVGVTLIAFAIPVGFPQTGWNAVGWIGLLPLVTGIVGYCPAYSLFGLKTAS